MLSEYELKIADFYNIPIYSNKKLLPNFFDNEIYVIHYKNLQLYLRLGLKLKKNTSNIRIQSYFEFNTQKRIEEEKNKDKDRKAFYKLISNDIYGQTMENLRNRTDVKLLKNKKYFLKCTSKPSYMFHKLFDNNLVTIHKSKLALKLSKPAYIGMCILDLSKILMHELHSDYVKTNMTINPICYSQTQIFQCIKLKLKMYMKILGALKNV